MVAISSPKSSGSLSLGGGGVGSRCSRGRRHSLRLLGVLAVLGLGLAAIPAAAVASPVPGIVTTTFTPSFSYDWAQAMAIQPDGKIVVVGTALGKLALARFNPDGAIDKTFGTGGTVTTAVGLGGAIARAVALQPDGKIVVSGYALCAASYQAACSSQTPDNDMIIARYNPNGSLDATFGSALPSTQTAGVVAPYYDFYALLGANPAQKADDFATGLVITGGKIFATGYSVDPSDGDQDTVAMCRTESGAICQNFGITCSHFSGQYWGDLGTPYYSNSGDFADGGNAAILESDGRFTVAGYNDGFFGLARFVTSRACQDTPLDTGFGATVHPWFGQQMATGAISLGGGKVLVGGYSSDPSAYFKWDFSLARFETMADPNCNGPPCSHFDLDGTFHTSGNSSECPNSGHYCIVLTPFGQNPAQAFGMALQGSKVVLVGTVGKPVAGGGSQTDFALARYTLDGNLDPTFGTGGLVTTDFNGGDDGLNAVAIQQGPPGGGGPKILVAGQVSANGEKMFALARYNPDGTLDPTFGQIVKATLTVFKSGGRGAVMSNPPGIECGATCSAKFEVGQTLTLTATPAAGSRFTGWGGDCTGNGVCAVTMNANRAVTAKFVLVAPNTRITKALIVRHKASFSFKAVGHSTGFECALTKATKSKPSFSSCKSPKAYTSLQPASYTFHVRAHNGSARDPTPALSHFKIR